jgi:tetratricopeptide (TPR) repeat protein
MFRIAFALLTMLQTPAASTAPSEIKDALAHAEALYYGARFGESITLLTKVDDALSAEQGRVPEKVETKLRLALANIGLNDAVKAKAYFMGMYALDPDYAIDTKAFSPKVLSVATDAKAEQSKLRCSAAQLDARKSLDSGHTPAFLDLFRNLAPKCAGLAAMGPEAAESFYKSGLAAYKKGDFPNALSNFEAAMTLSPEHELAREYADLTHGKLQLGEDQLIAQWQRNFEGRRFAAAASDYRQIMANNGGNTASATRVKGEYRKALSAIVDNWNRGCGHMDAPTIAALRGQVAEILPEPSFGEDIRGQMKSQCEEPKPAPQPAGEPQVEAAAPKGAAPATCFEMQPQLALARLKTRVDPVMTTDLRNYFKNTGEFVVRVKARITETGDVNVTGMPEGNPILNNIVRNAVAQWKFTPIRDENGTRCVDTEIPLLLKMGR